MTEPAATRRTRLEPLDLNEKGMREGRPISLDRRLFMKFTAYGNSPDPAMVIELLGGAGVEGVLYLDASDPRGIGLIAMSEDPEEFVGALRSVLNAAPFSTMTHKPELDMLGRTYSIGYEDELEQTLLVRPRLKVLDPSHRWAVWYPLQRTKSFQTLPVDKQRKILAEHGALGRRYGEAGLAADIRLACHGLDRNDNDFVIGLVGADLYPLSAVVQEMRRTEQTAQYLSRLGPFFIGRAIWRSPSRSGTPAR